MTRCAREITAAAAKSARNRATLSHSDRRPRCALRPREAPDAPQGQGLRPRRRVPRDCSRLRGAPGSSPSDIPAAVAAGAARACAPVRKTAANLVCATSSLLSSLRLLLPLGCTVSPEGSFQSHQPSLVSPAAPLAGKASLGSRLPGAHDTSHLAPYIIFLAYCFKHVTRLFVSPLLVHSSAPALPPLRSSAAQPPNQENRSREACLLRANCCSRKQRGLRPWAGGGQPWNENSFRPSQTRCTYPRPQPRTCAASKEIATRRTTFRCQRVHSKADSHAFYAIQMEASGLVRIKPSTTRCHNHLDVRTLAPSNWVDGSSFESLQTARSKQPANP